MTKLKLNGRSYGLPKRYTVDEWLQLARLDPSNAYDCTKIVSIGFRIPYWKLHDCDADSMILGAGLVLHNAGTHRECKIKNLSSIKLGEFIDLDILLVGGVEKNLLDILKILSEFPVTYADEALYLVETYSHWRTSVYRQYAGLFDLNKESEADEEEEAWNPNEVARGWYKLLVDLADDDILKLDSVADQSVYKAFTFLSLRKKKILEENFKQLEQKRKYDLQRNHK